MTTDFKYPDLKPCPFCESEARLREVVEHYDGDADSVRGSFTCGYTIGCDECGYEFTDEYRDTVVESWNTRRSDASLAGSRMATRVTPSVMLWEDGSDGIVRTRTPFGTIAVFKLANGNAICEPSWYDDSVTGSLDYVLDFVEDQYKRRVVRSLQTDGLGTLATHRHIKTGGLYRVVAHGKMQTEHWSEPDGEGDFKRVDMADVVIYQSMKDLSVWTRPLEEFNEKFRGI